MADASTGSGSAVSAALAPGMVLLGRYQVERLIGGGGMGMVYLARDQRLANRPCALKEMVDHFIDAKQRVEANDYFAREADTLAQLKHPAIPAVSDRFDDGNRHYLVMEYVEGRNLEEELAARGSQLPEGLVIDIARQLCDVLGYLHSFTPPIVYRDMKPSNVMLTPKGKVILVDFGIARLFRAASKGTMIGTLGFAPPEQYQGMVDPRADIYSLGATLHYILTGRDPEKFPPFSFPPVRKLRPDVSANVAGAIDAALKYKVGERPKAIQEFRDMLLYGRGLVHTGALGAEPKGGTADLSGAVEDEAVALGPRRRRSRVGRAIALLCFTAVLAGAAFGATYIYSDPALQQQLGLQRFIDNLPWKVQERLARAREHPLKFSRLLLQPSTREGSPVAGPSANFLNTDLVTNQYLAWKATFENRLYGLEGRDDKVEARFFDPKGLQIASSTAEQFVGPGQKEVNLGGVVLMPQLGSLPAGDYTVGLYMGDETLAQARFTVSEDLAALKQAEAARAAAAGAAKAAAEERKAAGERLALLEAARKKPLELLDIRFMNTTKTGTPISGPTTTFNAAQVLFVGWQVTFNNKLYNLDAGQYQLEATYIAPDGRVLGSVGQVENVRPSDRTAVFSGRVGNSAGGAFLPGAYQVNFYLNGQYLAQKKFRVLATKTNYPANVSGGPRRARGGGGGAVPSGASLNLSGPTLATGAISGLGGRDNVAMDLRLRPQANGFLHGELVIHEPGYGATPIEGFVRGDQVQFQVPYGNQTIYFEGERRADTLSGTFEAAPSGDRGTWTTHAD